MGRTAGSRSRDHAARRREILASIAERLSRQDAMHASYRDLAVAGEVSISTLQHYFGRRADIVVAVLGQARDDATPYLDLARRADGSFAQSIETVLSTMRLGFERFGLGELHALGLVEGLRSTTIGPVMVDAVLEPSIGALTERLAEHQAAGEMRRDSDPRHAALMLLSPLLILMLHQHQLGGAATHPADLDRFIAEHAKAFVLGHQSIRATSEAPSTRQNGHRD